MFRCIRASRCKDRRYEGTNWYRSKYIVNTVKHPDSEMVWG
jgi:hypothetical protein